MLPPMSTGSPSVSRGRGRPRGGTDATRATRECLIAAAYAMFADHGYRNTSLREIARHCGVSHATLLHHFPGKAALLEAALELSGNRFPVDLASADVDTLFTILLEAAGDSTVSDERMRMFNTLHSEAGDPDHPGHAWFVTRTEAFVSDVGQVLARAQADGTITAPWPPQAMAIHLLCLWDGLHVQWPLSPAIRASSIEQLRFAFEAILGRPLRTPEAPA